MATDERDEDKAEKDEAATEGESEASESEASESEASESEASKNDASAAEGREASSDEAEESDESEQSDGDETAAQPASAPPEKPAAKKSAEVEEDRAPERMRRARPKVPVGPVGQPPATSLGKSVTLFAVVVFGLGAGFYFLGKSEAGGDRNVPKWKVGQEVQVDITLDPRDDAKLACASGVEIGGKRCEFSSKTQKVEPAPADAALLKPYTTTDGVQFLAAGLWSHPELAQGKRPVDRFTVRCKLKVEGMVKAPAVRWDVGAAWGERPNDWYAGAVSGCTLVK